MPSKDRSENDKKQPTKDMQQKCEKPSFASGGKLGVNLMRKMLMNATSMEQPPFRPDIVLFDNA